MNPRVAIVLISALSFLHFLSSPVSACESGWIGCQGAARAKDKATAGALDGSRRLHGGRHGRKAAQRGSEGEYANLDEGVIGGRPSQCNIRIGRRLIAYCGCSVSLKVFGRPIRELFLAANWRKFPRAHPAPGTVAWRWGHVFYIESVYSDGTVMAYDPNSGRGLTRRHRVSLRGYRVVDPNGDRVAEAVSYQAAQAYW